MLANYLPSPGGWMAGGDDLREPALKRLQVITGHLLQVVGHGETAPRGLGSHVRTSYNRKQCWCFYTKSARLAPITPPPHFRKKGNRFFLLSLTMPCSQYYLVRGGILLRLLSDLIY